MASQRLRGTLGEGSSYSYTYDSIGQLTGARYTNAAGGTVSGLHRGYVYDAGCKRAWRANAGVQEFQADVKNQLTSSMERMGCRLRAPNAGAPFAPPAGHSVHRPPVETLDSGGQG